MEKFLVSSDYKEILKPLYSGEVHHYDTKPYLDYHYSLHVKLNPNFLLNLGSANLFFNYDAEPGTKKYKWAEKANELINTWIEDKEIELKAANFKKLREKVNEQGADIGKVSGTVYVTGKSKETPKVAGILYVSKPTKENPKVTETVTSLQSKGQSSKLVLTDLEVKNLYEEVKRFPALAEQLNSYQRSKVIAKAYLYREMCLNEAKHILNSNSNYPYPEEYKGGREFEYWLEIVEKNYKFNSVIQAFENLQPAKESRAPDQKPKGKPEKRVTKPVTWPGLFKDENSPDKILEILREEEYISAKDDWLLIGREMVALFVVLRKRGYLKPKYSGSYSAPKVAAAFNAQFYTDYDKKSFEIGKLDLSNDYTDRFNLIPEYKPEPEA